MHPAIDPAVSSESGEALDLLGMYFRDLGGIGVMSKEEEFTAATKIASLRTAFWRTLLGYLPFAAPICELAEALLPDESRPTEAIKVMQKAAKNLREREVVGNQKAFEAAREQLAAAMGRSDCDALVSDRVLADLVAAEAGKPCGALKVKLPPRNSAPFVQYVAAARRDHQALIAAKNAFVRANLRLVIAIARRFQRGHMPLQDLIQEGNLGLIKAVDRFDPARGFRFSTYGSWWIRHTISRAISDKARTVRLPVHLTEVAGKLGKASREFEKIHGRAATDDELVALTGVSAERIRRVRRTWVEAPVSLESPLTENGGLSLADAIEDTEAVSPSDVLDEERLLSNLDDVMAQLSPIELQILRLRLGSDDEEGLTLQEIGQRYALSRERIRQLQEKAIKKLRGEFQRRALLGN
jgi:RNA polymerase primary sigma factor